MVKVVRLTGAAVSLTELVTRSSILSMDRYVGSGAACLNLTL